MITFTKEQLIASAHARIEFAEMMLDGELEPLKERTWSIELELARIALASLEAEPVEWRVAFRLDGQSGSDFEKTFESQVKMNEIISLHERAGFSASITPLYTAPPAPVSVPDEMYWQNAPIEGSTRAAAYATGWNACRAAMLHGADQPQNEPQNVPENILVTQFNPVADLYGLTSPTGGETSFTFDAVEARDFIDGGWSCQEYVELERYQEAVLGNSPVIPDAYDIKAFGIFSATEGENGLMMEVDRFHFETDSCPQVGKDKFVPKFAIQAIINRLQKHCDNMEADALVNVLSTSAAPQQEVKNG